MADLKNFHVDGYGVNAEHYKNYKEADFIAEYLPGVPDKIGDEAAKITWCKKAFAAVQEAAGTAKPGKGKE